MNPKEKYTQLFESNGFMKIDEIYKPESFGNFVLIYSIDSLLVRLINDTDFLSLDIKKKNSLGAWINISNIRKALDEEDPTNSTIEESIKFIVQNTVSIENLLNSESVETTTKKP